MIFAAVVALLAMLVPAPKRLTGPDHRDRR